MKISLVCPVWNTPKPLFLACLRSVVGLAGVTEENFEAIFVDDGATDTCPRILDKFAEDCPFMKVVHQENAGNGVARNVGVGLATGDYVVFLDCDDRLCPDFLENVLRTVTLGYDAYHFNFYKVREKDDPTLYPVHPNTWGDMCIPPKGQTWVYAWAKIIRREFLLEHDIHYPEAGVDIPRLHRGAYRNYVRGEDNYYCALLLAEAPLVRMVPWFGIEHVQRKTSLGKSSVRDANAWMDDVGMYLVYRALYDEGAKRGNDALKDFSAEMMGLYWNTMDKDRCPKGWELPIIE